MIFVSIGVEGQTIKEDVNLKDALKSNGGRYYGHGGTSPESMVNSFITQLRALENQIIKKAIDLARSSTTPDNAAKKIRNVVNGYCECVNLYHERLGRMKGGEPLKDVIREYFFTPKGKEGYLPVKPVAICGTYTWDSIKNQKLPAYSKYGNVPRVLGVEIVRDMGIGEARLLSMEVTMGFSNEKSGAAEKFFEVGKYTVNLTMERVEDE